MKLENSPSKVAGSRPAVQPFLLDGGGDERGVGSLRGTVDDKGRARQRLERRIDIAAGVEIATRPRKVRTPSASAYDLSLKAEFASSISDALCAVGERSGRLGIGTGPSFRYRLSRSCLLCLDNSPSNRSTGKGR